MDWQGKTQHLCIERSHYFYGDKTNERLTYCIMTGMVIKGRTEQIQTKFSI